MVEPSEMPKIVSIGPIVGVAWLISRLDDPSVKIVDTRPFGSYMMGHIPGAVSLEVNAIQLLDSSAQSIAAFFEMAKQALRRAGIVPNDRVVFYEDYSGTSSARGVWLLDVVGHRRGAMLDGGLRAWTNASGPLTRDLPLVSESEIEIAPNHEVLATSSELSDALATGSAMTILDTRNEMEFASGTIPGSLHVEWTNHLQPNGLFRPLDEIRALYRSVGIDDSNPEPVITFCGSGYRSANTYVALRALGVPTVKNYAPSWGEWGWRRDLPVEDPRCR